jgi:hypothetical protein
MLGTTVAAAILLAISGTAEAAGIGLDHDMLTTYLDCTFTERPVALGELDGGNEVELFTSRSGSWTLAERLPDGEVRIIASGLKWQRAPSDMTGQSGQTRAAEPRS